MKYHTPVLLDESIKYLNIKPEGFYIDCTLGEAGHSQEILKKLSSKGLLVSIDQDQEAIDFVKANLEIPNNWIIIKGNFENLKKLISDFKRKPDGILMDIGISSRQIDIPGRGFSYLNDNDPLDMRMDQNLNVKASDLLKALSVSQLTYMFREYGEERYAYQIAKAIKNSEVNTVKDLKSLVYKVVPATKRREDSHHPARRVFQALRIAVNDELNALQKALDDGFEVLNTQGRIVVITFHSLEDRIVKRYFEKLVNENKGTLIAENILASDKEISENKRSHSAKLRTIEKI